MNELFIKRMKELLKDDFDAFINSLNENEVKGFYLNPLKKDVLNHLNHQYIEKHPYVDGGYYFDYLHYPLGKSPYFMCGLYYIQEPSAMSVAACLDIKENDYVLDMCGAPGGKTCYVASRLSNEGLMIANDISKLRASILSSNIERFGLKNTIVTNCDPLKMKFESFFDKIILDAPCSGEGMFRKGNNEIKNWQQKGSEPYAKLQREIVDDAIKLLAPGGMLLYSTCTFSPEENEQVIEYLLEKNEDLSLVPMKMCEGFDHGHPEWTLTGREDIKQCIRLWPHKIKGEGHFLALLKKADGEQPTFKYEKIKKVKLTPETEEFFKNCKMDIDWSHVREHQGKLFYLKEDIPEMKKVRVLRKGLYLGEMKKGRFEPSQSFAVALAANEYEPYLSFDINDENTVKYLKCETLDVDTNTEGIHLVGTNEFPLGWAKIKKGRLKNKYSSSWRWL